MERAGVFDNLLNLYKSVYFASTKLPLQTARLNLVVYQYRMYSELLELEVSDLRLCSTVVFFLFWGMHWPWLKVDLFCANVLNTSDYS